MSDVDATFEAFKRSYEESGSADPAPYLERHQEPSRQELAALIDGYLARRPRREFATEEFAGSYAENLADGLHRSLHGHAGIWPVVLPRLRGELPPSGLAERLAAALGVSNRAEKVGRYYQEMEHGRLPAARVSDRVIEALAEIVGTTPNAIRAAGAPIAAPVEMFASRADDQDWDEVDDLFRGPRQAEAAGGP